MRHLEIRQKLANAVLLAAPDTVANRTFESIGEGKPTADVVPVRVRA
jgi:hypothetical protein